MLLLAFIAFPESGFWSKISIGLLAFNTQRERERERERKRKRVFIEHNRKKQSSSSCEINIKGYRLLD